jgi:type I restriction enzyme S subunit
MSDRWPLVQFRRFLQPNSRPYELAPDEDANLVGMRWYGEGPFHREYKLAVKIAKKSHFVIRAGDVIYNKLFAWKGSFGVVPSELDGMFVSDKFPTYEADLDQVDLAYLRWFFRWSPLWDQAKDLSTGSAAISKLTLNPPRFLELAIRLPPVPDQRRIVARIEELADKIGDAKQLQAESGMFAAALFQSELDRIMNFPGALGSLGQVLLQPPRNGWSARCDNSEGGTPVLALGAVTGFLYQAHEFKRTSLPTLENAHYWLRAGDLLMTRSNTPDLVGHAAIYSGSPPNCVYPDLMMRLDVNVTRALKQFVWYWLQTTGSREYIRAKAKGSSPTMKKISQVIVMAIPFPTGVTVDEQRRRVEQCDSVRLLTDMAQHLRTESRVCVNSLLPSVLDKALRGEL